MKLRNKKTGEIIESENWEDYISADEKNNDIKFRGQPFCGEAG